MGCLSLPLLKEYPGGFLGVIGLDCDCPPVLCLVLKLLLPLTVLSPFCTAVCEGVIDIIHSEYYNLYQVICYKIVVLIEYIIVPKFTPERVKKVRHA